MPDGRLYSPNTRDAGIPLARAGGLDGSLGRIVASVGDVCPPWSRDGGGVRQDLDRRHGKKSLGRLHYWQRVNQVDGGSDDGG